jgi:hygromycin-B 4-O-kinase
MWKPMIDATVVRERIAGEIGPVTAWEAVTEGENSQAYRAVADGRDIVVRVNLRREGFDLDAWACRLDHGIKVPEVLAIGAVDAAWFCVSTRLAGSRLCDLDMPAVKAAAPAVAETLRRIHDVPVAAGGFGGIDPATGSGRAPTWASAVAWGVPESWSEIDDQADREFLEALSASVLAEVRTLPDFDRLLHGDFTGDNLIVGEDGGIGVIDWETAMVGDPLWDVAYQLFWSRAMANMVPQARAAAAGAAPEGLDRIRCYMLVTGLRSASFYLGQTRTPALDLMIDMLRAMPKAPATIADFLPDAA